MKKIKIDTYHQLENQLIKEWEEAWKKSDRAHIFNSPYWYQACVNSKKYKKLLILVCRSNENNGEILGMLPLVLSKKLGFTVYLSPGDKYLDKSTLFLANESERVRKALLTKLEEFGNYYLTEVSETDTALITKTLPRVGISQCSEGRYLPITGEPFKFVSRENVRRLRKRIRDNAEILNFKISLNNIADNIKIIKEIENESPKKNTYQDVFSDKFLEDLCLNIQNLHKNSLNFTFLYYKNEPICYKYGFITNNIYHYSNTAYKTNFKNLSPGRLLMFLTIDELFKRGIKLIDFSRGDTLFKRGFTPYTYRQYSIYHLDNIFVMSIWKFLYLAKNYLDKNDNLVELTRVSFNKIFKHHEKQN